MLQQPAFTSDSAINRLRDLLDRAERSAAAMRTDANAAAELLALLEQAAALLGELQPRRIDVRAEEGRYDSLRRRVLQAAPTIAPLLARAGQNPAGTLWADVQARAVAHRQRQRRRLGVTLAVLAVLAVLVFVVVPRIFPPTPIANTTLITQALAQNAAAAIATAQAEATRAPTDPLGPLWVGVLEEQRGNSAQAEAAFAEARARSFNDGEFLLDRAQVYVQVGDLDRAERDGRTLLETPASAPMGHLMLGTVAELREQYDTAAAAYEQAAALAEVAGQPELVVTARTRLAGILQRRP